MTDAGGKGGDRRKSAPPPESSGSRNRGPFAPWLFWPLSTSSISSKMRPSISVARAVRSAAASTSRLATVRPTVSALASSSASSSSAVAPRQQTQVANKRTFFSLPDISKLAGLVPGQQNSGGVQNDGEEQRFQARKVFP